MYGEWITGGQEQRQRKQLEVQEREYGGPAWGESYRGVETWWGQSQVQEAELAGPGNGQDMGGQVEDVKCDFQVSAQGHFLKWGNLIWAVT